MVETSHDIGILIALVEFRERFKSWVETLGIRIRRIQSGQKILSVNIDSAEKKLCDCFIVCSSERLLGLPRHFNFGIFFARSKLCLATSADDLASELAQAIITAS